MRVWEWIRSYSEGKAPEAVAGMVLATYVREMDVPEDDIIPVQIDAIAHWMGVRVEESTEPMHQSAALDSVVDPPVIVLRPGDHIHHRRFSIAHELGHLMLHDRGRHDRDVATPAYFRTSRERQANDFAAALLMPAVEVRSDAIASGADPWRLSRRYLVSEIAMTYRLKKLRLIP